MPLLRIENLSVSYGDGPACALDGVSLALEPGESIGILGESGSGKSTLALSIPQLLPRSAIRSGRVTWRGRDLSAAPERELRSIRGREVSSVFQLSATALNPFVPIGSQVAEVARAHGAGRREAASAARAAMELAFDSDDVGRISDSFAHELSGGQQQRACIARAIVSRPAVIIADEPTASLDGVAQRGVLDLFQRLRRELGASLILITHNPAILPDLVDRVVVLARGRVVEDGPLREVFRRPRHPQTSALLRAARATRVSLPGRSRDAGADPVLRARAVTKTHKRESVLSFRTREIVAVDNVDFEVPRGGSVALVGSSGSGKSTLARCLAGLDLPTAGAIERAPGAFVQLVAQDAAGSLNPRFTAAEAVAEPLVIRRWKDRDARRAEAGRLMTAMGLPSDATGRLTARFSGGQKQRLAVARTLAATPDVVIWDESFSALDLPLQDELLELLQTVRRDLSLSYVFIAHDLTLAARACDEIAVMSHGRIVERRPAAELLASPAHPVSRALVEAIPRIPPDLEAIA